MIVEFLSRLFVSEALVDVIGAGSLLWVMGLALSGVIASGALELVAIALIGAVIWSLTVSGRMVQSPRGVVLLLFASMAATTFTLTTGAIYIGSHFSWQMYPSFHDGWGFFSNVDHFVVLTYLSVTGVWLAVWWAKRRSRVSWRDLGVRAPVSGTSKALLYLVLALACILTIQLFWHLLAGGSHMPSHGGVNTRHLDLSSVSRAGVMALLILNLALVPLAAELFYRGFFTIILERVSGTTPAVVLQAVIFAMAHDLSASFALFLLLGVLLGFIYVRTRSIFVTTLAHSAWNLSAMLMA